MIAPMLVGPEFLLDPALMRPHTVTAAMCAGLGTAVKFSRVTWQSVEPGALPPGFGDDGRYAWGRLDTQMDEAVAAGFREITIVLGCRHPSYTAATYTPPPGYSTGGFDVASSPPKNSASLAMYGRLVNRLVARYAARYAGRGVTLVLEVESEWQSPAWFLGRLEDYLTMLGTAYAAAKSADASCIVCLGGHTFDDLLDDSPSDLAIEARLASIAEPGQTLARRSLANGQGAIAAGGYNRIEIHSLSSETGIRPAFERTRAYMPIGISADITIGDCFPGQVVLYSRARFNNPAPEDVMSGAYARLASGDLNAVAAFRAGQVRTMQRKFKAMYEAGCTVAHAGPIVDWQILTGYPFQGLFDVNGIRRPVCQVLAAWGAGRFQADFASGIALG